MMQCSMLNAQVSMNACLPVGKAQCSNAAMHSIINSFSYSLNIEHCQLNIENTGGIF